jgi:hypothetical protein
MSKFDTEIGSLVTNILAVSSDLKKHKSKHF